MDSETVAWAFYDDARQKDQLQMNSGDEEKAPYRSVLDSMQEGWFVMQIPTLPYYFRGEEHEVGHLPYEYVLERWDR